MPDIRSLDLGNTPEQVLAREVARLRRDLKDLRSTVLGRPLPGEWTPYTPTWVSLGTQPTLGNGTLTGAYVRIGMTIHYRVKLVFGSTTSAGTAVWIFGWPVTPHADQVLNSSLNTTGLVSRPGFAHYPLIGRSITPTGPGIILLVADNNTLQIGQGTPLTFTTNDMVLFEGNYEAAA